MTRAHHVNEDGFSTASDISYDPYAEIVDPSQVNAPTVPASQRTMHTPYGSYQQQQQQYLTVVHHNGKVAWVPYSEGTTLANVRDEVARQIGVYTQQSQFARACPLMEDTPLARQCMPSDIVYIMPESAPKPTVTTEMQPAPMYQQPQHQQQRELPSAPVTPLLPVSVPTTPLSASGSFTSAMYHNPSFSANTTPLSMPVAAPGWSMQLEDKLANAAANLSQVIAQSRQCTELQQDLENAVGRGIDCSAVFQACERSLAELILHPSGNYLVSKCFELCPGLIDSAVGIIANDVRTYALHKHGSYVVEAILTSSNAGKQCKGDLIAALISPTNRFGVATHDSGNFVLQKAIENCPEEMLWRLQEAVQAVFHMSTHGPKMLKKLETRLSKSQNAANTAAKAPANTLPLPPSTAAYLNQVNQQMQHVSVSQQQVPQQVVQPKVQVPHQPVQAPPQQQPVVPVVHAPYATTITSNNNKVAPQPSKDGAKETWSLDTTTAPVADANKNPAQQQPQSQVAYPPSIRGPYTGSWADAEDDPLSPPRMFTEGGRVPLP